MFQHFLRYGCTDDASSSSSDLYVIKSQIWAVRGWEGECSVYTAHDRHCICKIVKSLSNPLWGPQWQHPKRHTTPCIIIIINNLLALSIFYGGLLRNCGHHLTKVLTIFFQHLVPSFPEGCLVMKYYEKLIMAHIKNCIDVTVAPSPIRLMEEQLHNHE